MTAFELELALDRVEAELATELPAHLRAFAAAYAGGAAIPAAPDILRRPATRDLARHALEDPALASRGLQLLRLVTPIAIEDDPTVAAIRSTAPSWPAYRALAAARNAASTRLFGGGYLAPLQWLHGAGEIAAESVPWPAELAGWHEPGPPLPAGEVERAWQQLAERHGARGRCRIVASDARPRTFVVEPGREVIVVVGPLTTPALRFAALHELGHALAGLLSPVALPRMLDEAAAAYVARLCERDGDLDGAWYSPVAEPARTRRVWLLLALTAIERGAPPPGELARPPWSLWHDPGAQAMYSVAERFALHWWQSLGPRPESGAFAQRLAVEVARVDAAVLADRELARAIHPAS